ncbi:MAG: hypothetical protein AAFZ15_09270 [Bacteroidota bacterium]
MKNSSSRYFQLLFFYGILLLLRRIITTFTWEYFGIFNGVGFSWMDTFFYSILLSINELGGIVFYFIVFLLMARFSINHFQVKGPATIYFLSVFVALISLALMDNSLLKSRTYHDFSWTKIKAAEIRNGFQFSTFLVLSLIFAFRFNRAI